MRNLTTRSSLGAGGMGCLRRLLVGPELFGAVISEVAAVDLLRLPETPVGATQTPGTSP